MEAVNLIPAPLSGREFLASSHLKIGNDDRYIKEGWNSTFDTDFVPPAPKHKPDAALPPLPARFMHQDQEKINTRISETREAFPVKLADANSDTRDKYGALYRTNFKPNSDSRINTFKTTHNYYYRPKPTSQPPDNSKLAIVWAKSSFPQGDKEKADDPISTYRTGFKGHDTSKIKMDRVQSQHWGGEPTIKGDRTRRFGTTTHNDTFFGLWNPPPNPAPKHFWSSVPEGDKEKVMEHSTTMRRAFNPHEIDYKPQNSAEAYSKLFSTNYKEKDGKGTFNKYQSTAKDSYPPIPHSDQRVKRSRDRNASDIPEGDTDPSRGTDRVNLTTTRNHHPPLVSDTSHVDGSKLRTKSNVLLGEPPLAGTFYDTTCDSTYRSVNVPRLKVQTYYPSVVPLDYYDKQTSDSTTWSDFQNPGIKRIFPDPVALENLRKTHFSPPLRGQSFFSTTHNSHYTAKKIAKHEIDPGSLQRSSLPIGTLGQYIPGSHVGWDVAA